MKFNKVYEEATCSADVQGLPKRIGPMVRRKIKNPVTQISSIKKKKK